MRIYRHIAALAALSLLCGCSNSTTSSAPEVTSAETSAITAEAPQETTSEQTAPGGVPAVTSANEATSADPAVMSSDNSGGVDLVSEKYSENSLIFDLNGTYCDVSKLPFSVETFKPELTVQRGYLCNVRGGKLIFQGWSENDLPDQNNWSIFTYDLRTEELTEVFNAKAALPDVTGSAPLYANEEYVVVGVYPDYVNTYRVFGYGNNDPVLTLPDSDEDSHYFTSGSMYIIYDQLFFDGECRFAGFDKSVPVIYRAYLTHDDFDVYAANVKNPRYGVCNVCFNLDFQDLTGVVDSSYLSDLRGDIFLEYDDQTHTILEGTYYPIQIRGIEDEILGFRYAVSWLDKRSDSYEIGTTGFGYSADRGHITIDGIFMLPLYHENTGTIKKLLVGMHDKYTDTNRAALIPCEYRSVFTENTALYYVDRATLETVMLSPHEEVFLYADGEIIDATPHN
ncbi:MAG: hypothetical protein ACI4WS_06140 [Oscillospiraceae bacterium]